MRVLAGVRWEGSRRREDMYDAGEGGVRCGRNECGE